MSHDAGDGNTPVSHQYPSQASSFKLQSVFVPYSINNTYHSPKSSSIQPTILKVSAKLSVGQIASERFSHRDPSLMLSFLQFQNRSSCQSSNAPRTWTMLLSFRFRVIVEGLERRCSTLVGFTCFDRLHNIRPAHTKSQLLKFS